MYAIRSYYGAEISPNKIGWRQWAEVMEAAHGLGMRTTATMMFGSRERPEDIVEHLFRVREIQQRTGGFTAFIPWTFQPDNTELGGETAGGVAYLRVLALSRVITSYSIHYTKLYEILAAKALSEDVYEIVSKSLNG